MSIVLSRRQFFGRLLRVGAIVNWGIPKPRLELGQMARYSWVNDDRLDTSRVGMTECLIGRIVGMCWKDGRWTYFLHKTYSSYPNDVFSNPEEFFESELEALGRNPLGGEQSP